MYSSLLHVYAHMSQTLCRRLESIELRCPHHLYAKAHCLHSYHCSPQLDVIHTSGRAFPKNYNILINSGSGAVVG